MPSSAAEAGRKASQAAPGEPVLVNWTWSRSVLPILDERQRLDLLLEITPPHSEPRTLPVPVNLCLILDRSTSMQGERLDLVKAATAELVRLIQPEDTLAVVTFSDRAEVLQPARRHPDWHELEGRLYALQASGGTEILQGLETGLFETRRNYTKRGINHILLLTDGRTYGDEAGCLELAEEAGTLGIGITCLGVGGDWNDDFLDSLASRTGGSSQYLSQAEEIRDCFRRKLDSLTRLYSGQVLLDLHPEAENVLETLFRLAPDPLPLPVGAPIRLGGLPRESAVVLLLEFIVPPLAGGSVHLQLASGQLRFDLPGQSGPARSIPFQLSCPVSTAPEPETPPLVLLKALSQVNLYRMQERAHQELADGDAAAATRRLLNLATHLFARGETALGQTVLQEAEQLQAHRAPHAERKKKIKYGTRALVLPENAPPDPPMGSQKGEKR